MIIGVFPSLNNWEKLNVNENENENENEPEIFTGEARKNPKGTFLMKYLK